ncbi:P-selectin-like [Branchiostoma floridae x Branchiostoma belcheri]
MNGHMDGSCTFQGVLRFRCNRGYNLVGTATITCQAGGTWSGSIPTCKAVQCSKPTPPKNGHMVGSTLYKGKMHFICARGYNLVGARYITCQADGTWSGSVPTCKAAECKIGEPPVNGLMKKRRIRGINYLEFHCNQGYRLVGAKAIRCQTDGTWSDSVPTCKAICRKGYQLLAKTCIGISLFRKKYSEAEAACKSEGAKLAMPKTRELDLALRRLIRMVGKNSDYWIGLKRENSWQWADGSYLKNNDYKGWNPGEPESAAAAWFSGSKCVMYWSKPTGKPMWDDTRCHHRIGYICQAPYQRPLKKGNNLKISSWLGRSN